MVESFKHLSNKFKLFPRKFLKARRRPFPTLSTPIGGRIAMAPCPGMSGDLDGDLELIGQWGATIVVTLVEQSELKKAGAENLGKLLTEKNILWFHMPIKDCDIPDISVRPMWLDMKPLLRYRLAKHKARILVHCWAGCGRAGMIAAKILMQCGMTPDEAVHHVRSVKPDAIDTFAQMRWLGESSW